MTTLTAPRRRLLSRPLLLVSATDLLGLAAFYTLLPAVPAAVAASGAGGAAAGLTTGVLMAATVAAELALPRVVARFGYRAVVAAGLVLLGLPALALTVTTDLAIVLVVCALRGAGVATIFVVCGAWSAHLVPPDRRGEGLGVVGVVAGIPAVVGMPAGLWLAQHFGHPAVFVTGAALALAGLAALPPLPGADGRDTGGPAGAGGMVRALREPALTRPALVFGAAATLAGVVATFLPAVLPRAGAGLVAAALLVQALAGTVTRWWAGRAGDRHGPRRLLTPAMLATAAGLAALAVAAHPAAVLTAAAVFGAGFGALQTASLTVMLDAVPPARYGTVTAVWSVAYDAGLGAGAAGFGVLAAVTGYPAGLAVAAGLAVTTLAVLRRPVSRAAR
ncbi:MFS transporter [Dactylosporangium aurantiacum]|uniref:MFS transporter n=1 Tax=Dactylosporangium aurantiacum TaxID=35754 RepID=A0A9Q9IPQ4_9ACTN|nr:MFS transporter [Dactylosporangium aurantiacum]MDG6105621.1 MFS transporter [Dactylosporangium aurantiacum]UWZ57045.1 MFS transporter [Dactylosporangium aurantiacum]